MIYVFGGKQAAGNKPQHAAYNDKILPPLFSPLTKNEPPLPSTDSDASDLAAPSPARTLIHPFFLGSKLATCTPHPRLQESPSKIPLFLTQTLVQLLPSNTTIIVR